MSEYCKVMIIDDEFITRQGIKHMMLWEAEGFQIVGEASNGQEGLELIEQLKPDIVLADIVMPVMNGIDFCMILQERYPGIQLIVLSSYDNFEYVRTTLLHGAVDYVLKPTLSPQLLLDALKKAARNIPGLYLGSHGDASAEMQMERYFSGYQEHLDKELCKNWFPHMQYRVLAADLKKVCAGNQKQMAQLRELVQKTFQTENFETYVSFWAEQEILCFVVNYQKKQEEAILELIRTAAEKAGKEMGRVLFILSGAFKDPEDVKRAYEKDVEPYLGQKFYFSEETLVYGEHMQTPDPVERFAYEQYIECLKTKSFLRALTLLRDYTENLCDNQHDEYLMKNLLKNLLYNFLMEINKYGTNSERLKNEYFRSIDSSDSLETFRTCVSCIFQELEELTGSLMEDTDLRIVEIKEYINRHYSEKLDLMAIAQEFSFNYHYISSYFNQHITEGFSGYLNKVRIEKACTILKDSKMPIADISGAVGYSDHGYFCRIFKKRMGQTPSQYRNSSNRPDKE